jgi:5-deoxy-D-glucuronate isomerase
VGPTPNAGQYARGFRRTDGTAGSVHSHSERQLVKFSTSSPRDNSSYHEETYYCRFLPENGFAIQRIYTRDTDLDVAIPVLLGDVLLIHEGYHPVVNVSGTNAYYLNSWPGTFEKFRPANDSHYDWAHFGCDSPSF